MLSSLARMTMVSCFWIAFFAGTSLAQNSSQFAQNVETYCLDCHVGEDAEGGIKLSFLSEGGSFSKHVETVEKVIRVLEEGQMPPIDAEQMETGQRIKLLAWVQSKLEEFDCGDVSRPGRVTMRRLNKVEYDNTIHDLTGLDLNLAKDFPSDDVGNGFDNIGDVLTIPPILLEKYLDAAVTVAQAVVENEAAEKRVFPNEIIPGDENALQLVSLNVEHLMTRAFRRRVAEEEVGEVVNLMVNAFQGGRPVEQVKQLAIAAVLSSPHFIYKTEADDPNQFVNGVRPLDDYEIASRLSYFIWSSMPDEELFKLAAARKLHTEKEIEQQVERMLADPKSEALVKNFAGQWLQLRDVTLLAPDPEMFDVDPELLASMQRESELLFADMIRENKSILQLLEADYSYINQRLAEHYGIETEFESNEFKKIDLAGSRRGMLMHASILLLTSNPTRTSPVKRGKWVLDNLLDEPPPPPPPDVPELEEGGEVLGTLRQQMEQHRADPNCAVCHTKMDALGFGLENFDAVGKWRESDGRDKIDPSGTLPGGKSFAGPVDLVKILAEEKKEAFCRCMSKKLLTYALGRGLGIHDRCTVNTIVAKLDGEDHKFGSLVKAIATSPPFMNQESGR